MSKKPSGTFYRHILADAWSVLKRNKALWVLGFFVSFLGNGGVYELLIQGTGKLGLRQDFGGFAAMASMMPNLPHLLAGFGRIGASQAFVYSFMAVISLALTAVAVWAVVSSQGGLIIGVRDAAKDRPASFSKLFSAGNETFWPLFALNVLSRLAIALFFYLLLSFLVLLLAKVTLLNSLLYLLAFVVLIPLTLIVGFVTIFAACYMTLQRLTLVESILAAIELFRERWLIAIETALILFGINVAVTIGTAVLLLALAVLFLPFLVAGTLVSGIGTSTVLIAGAVCGVALLVIVGAGLAAFQYSVWTLLFIKLHTRGHGAAAKIVRFFRKLLV